MAKRQPKKVTKKVKRQGKKVNKKGAEQEKAFTKAYLTNGRNATAAYRVIHPTATRGTCATEGCKTLNKPDIAKKIALADQKRHNKYEITADRILVELASIAFNDIEDLVDEAGTLKPISEMPERARRAITSLDVSELSEGTGATLRRRGSIKKIRLADKLQALNILAKQQGMLVEKQEITINDNLSERLRRGKARAKGPTKS